MPRPPRRPKRDVRKWPSDLDPRTWQAVAHAVAHGFDDTAETDDPLHPRREWLAAVYAAHRSTFVADFERQDATHPLGRAPAVIAWPVAVFETEDAELRARAIACAELPGHWPRPIRPQTHPWRYEDAT